MLFEQPDHLPYLHRHDALFYWSNASTRRPIDLPYCVTFTYRPAQPRGVGRSVYCGESSFLESDMGK